MARGNSTRIDRRSFLHATGAGVCAAMAGGVAGASDDRLRSLPDCEVVTNTWKESGQLSAGEERTFTYAVRGSSPCRLAASLTVPGGSDFDLYMTLDGRTPSEDDYDRISRSPDSDDERIELKADSIPAGGSLGILLRSYEGDGDFSLVIEEFGTDASEGRTAKLVNEETVSIDEPVEEIHRRGRYDLVSDQAVRVELIARPEITGEIDVHAVGDRSIREATNAEVQDSGEVEFPGRTMVIVEEVDEYVSWSMEYETDFLTSLLGKDKGTYEITIREYAFDSSTSDGAPQLVNREVLEEVDRPVRDMDLSGVYDVITEKPVKVVLKAYPEVTGEIKVSAVKDNYIKDVTNASVATSQEVRPPGPATLVLRDVDQFVNWKTDYDTGILDSGWNPFGKSKGTYRLVVEEYAQP